MDSIIELYWYNLPESDLVTFAEKLSTQAPRGFLPKSYVYKCANLFLNFNAS